MRVLDHVNTALIIKALKLLLDSNRIAIQDTDGGYEFLRGKYEEAVRLVDLIAAFEHVRDQVVKESPDEPMRH